MIIRKAKISDSEQIAQCLLLAMDDIVYRFIGTRNPGKALVFMQYFAGLKTNQYSFENCWVATEDKRVVATINVYNGADLAMLRAPVLNYIEKQFNRKIMPEDETQAGEFYIDSLGVMPEYSGKGRGTGLLNAVIEEFVAKRGETLGLLVDVDNPKAKQLYLRLGFEIAGKKTLMGKEMEHLQMSPKRSASPLSDHP
jgi:ribosomal protein S18 acetylase RimI-like enzyme